MILLEDIPVDIDAFLRWLKISTEAAWKDVRTPSLEDFEAQGSGGRAWRNGTRWQPGLDERQIDALETRWNMRFPHEYRRLLAILNAPDRGMLSVEWSDEAPYGLCEATDEPSYFDWQHDDAALAYALGWPVEGLLFDVESNSVWPDSWGERPASAEGRREKVARLVASAPPLVPIVGHRYLLVHPVEAANPVLSVWQSDIVVYGSSLRNFLLLEFADLLGLDRDEVALNANIGITAEAIAAIPYWGELIGLR